MAEKRKFLGIKQVKKSTFDNLPDAGKTGYLWFVREQMPEEGEPDDCEIYLGTRKYGWVKQKGTEYEAGDNIIISGNTISAVDTTYIAGDYISISGNTISADGLDDIFRTISSNINELSEKVDEKQNVLTAGDNIQISGNTISATDTTYSEATTGQTGLMSAEDKIKLDNALTSYTDTNTWRNVTVNGSELLGTDTGTGSLSLSAGTNVTLTTNNGTIIINSSGGGGDPSVDTWRQIKLNNTEILGADTSTNPLNIITGSNISIENSNGNLTISATDTTYSASDFDIKDLTDSTNLRTTWSGKQNKLIEGTGITISGDVISILDPNSHRTISVNGSQVLGNNTTPLNLRSGTDISITADGSGNVTITNTGGGGGGGTTYTAGENIIINGTEISAEGYVYDENNIRFNTKGANAIGHNSFAEGSGSEIRLPIDVVFDHTTFICTVNFYSSTELPFTYDNVSYTARTGDIVAYRHWSNHKYYYSEIVGFENESGLAAIIFNPGIDTTIDQSELSPDLFLVQYGAVGDCSHSEGSGTIASGVASHAEGSGTTASGFASHASGVGTIADNSGMTSVGAFNKASAYDDLFAVGDGINSSYRTNAFTVHQTHHESLDKDYTTLATVNGHRDVYLGLPIGTIAMWGGLGNDYSSLKTDLPNGWLLCDGSVINVEQGTSSDYDFAIIGTQTTYYYKDANIGEYSKLLSIMGIGWGYIGTYPSNITGVKLPDFSMRFPIGTCSYNRWPNPITEDERKYNLMVRIYNEIYGELSRSYKSYIFSGYNLSNFNTGSQSLIEAVRTRQYYIIDSYYKMFDITGFTTTLEEFKNDPTYSNVITVFNTIIYTRNPGDVGGLSTVRLKSIEAGVGSHTHSVNFVDQEMYKSDSNQNRIASGSTTIVNPGNYPTAWQWVRNSTNGAIHDVWDLYQNNGISGESRVSYPIINSSSLPAEHAHQNMPPYLAVNFIIKYM